MHAETLPAVPRFSPPRRTPPLWLVLYRVLGRGNASWGGHAPDEDEAKRRAIESARQQYRGGCFVILSAERVQP